MCPKALTGSGLQRLSRKITKIHIRAMTRPSKWQRTRYPLSRTHGSKITVPSVNKLLPPWRARTSSIFRSKEALSHVAKAFYIRVMLGFNEHCCKFRLPFSRDAVSVCSWPWRLKPPRWRSTFWRSPARSLSSLASKSSL